MPHAGYAATDCVVNAGDSIKVTWSNPPEPQYDPIIENHKGPIMM